MLEPGVAAHIRHMARGR